MTPPASSAHERSAAALRLLFLGALSAFVLRLLFMLVETLFMRVIQSGGPEGEWFRFGQGVLSLLPAGLSVLGLLRFATTLEGAGARRWAQVAAVFLGVRELTYLGGVIAGPFMERMARTVILVTSVTISLAAAAAAVATLMTVWKGGRLLGVRPPRALFLAIGGLVALGLVGRAVFWNLSDLQQRLLLLTVMRGPSLAAEALLVAGLFLTRAELLRTREADAEAAEWRAAAGGLTLWLRGLYALLGMSLLGVGLMMGARSLLSGVSPEVVLMGALSLPLAMMGAGLVQYARVPEASGARAPALVALSLFVLVFASFPLLAHEELALAPRVLGLVAMAFLCQSFHRAAPSHAATTKEVGQVLIISSAVTLAMSLFAPWSGLMSVFFFLVAVVNLVYGVRFLALVHRMRRLMGPETPAAAPLFSQA